LGWGVAAGWAEAVAGGGVAGAGAAFGATKRPPVPVSTPKAKRKVSSSLIVAASVQK